MTVPVPDPTADAEDATRSAARADERAAGEPGPGRSAVSRKMLDDIFGDVLPAVTRDELDDRGDRAGRDADTDRWYRDNRPPHHG